MKKRSLSNLAVGFSSSWPTALIGVVVIKAVLSLAVKPGSFLVSYSGISYFLLLLLATGFAIRNGIRQTLGSRPFWVLLAVAYGLWSLNQGLELYYELGRHIDAPDNSIVDPILFLHIVPLMAAVATLPRRKVFDRKPYRVILNTLLLLFFWGFLYGYSVFPYQYLFSSSATPSSYGVRFDILYLLENLALVLAVGILTLRVQPPWKSVNLHLFGASILYTLSSAVANLAIDSGGYINGKLYGLGLTASVCWFVWIPLRARELSGGETKKQADSDRSQRLRSSVWPLLAVLMISIPIVWELSRRNEDLGLRTLRLVIAIAAFVCIASVAYLKEHLDRRELIVDVGVVNDQLCLAMQGGTCVGWDLDVKSGRELWFGDLQTIFGITSDRHLTTVEEFITYVHPDDRQRVSEALADARQSLRPYAQEFRIIRADGTIRWLTGRGKFYSAATGKAVRMVGVSLDITERKMAEAKLREYEKAVEGSEDMIAVVDRDYRYLIANRKFLRLRNMTKEQVVGRFAYEVLNEGVFESIVKEKLDQCFQGNVVRFEMKYTYPEHGDRDVLISYFPIEGLTGVDRVACIMQDITERKRTEDALRASERRLRLAQQAARIGNFERDVQSGRVTWAEGLDSLYGLPPGSVDGKTPAFFKDLIHPDDRERVAHIIQEALKTGQPTEGEWRAIWPDATVHWIAARWQVLMDDSGKPSRVVGVNLDITERKRAEEALSRASSRVIEVEERERKRIAMDLHENIGQRLALLAIGIEQLKKDLPNQSVDILDSMDAIWMQSMEILADVKASAHELYSPRLEYLAFAQVVRCFCKEFGERQKVEIHFTERNVPTFVSPDVSICLFRVVQEALRNTVKHSGAMKCAVRLWSANDSIHLMVSDNGVGFEVESARKGRAAGLNRIEERLKLVKGTFSVESQPGLGTRVYAHVPLVETSSPAAAA